MRKGYDEDEIDDRSKVIAGLLKEGASDNKIDDSEEVLCWVCGKEYWGGFLIDGDKAVCKTHYRKINIDMVLPE